MVKDKENPRFYFTLIAIAAAIGLGNIWIFSYKTFWYSGLFFIPYIIALLVLGVPLLMLEFSLGQYFSKNVVDLFEKVRSGFAMLGWLILLNCFILMSYYAVIFAWNFIYILVSFGQQWQYDSVSYFFNNVVQISQSLEGFSSFSLPVFISLIIVWCILFIIVRKGFESIKKWFLFLMPVFVVLLIFFMIYTLSLDNALLGIYALFKPNWAALLDLRIWIKAFTLATISLGLGFGIMSTLGKHNRKDSTFRKSLIVVMSEILVSIGVAFIVFSMIGFLSGGENIGEYTFNGYVGEFSVLANALPHFYKPTLLSLMFFLFISLFFVFGICSLALSVIDVLSKKFKTKEDKVAILVCGFGFLFGLFFVIKPGFYVMDIVSYFFFYNILVVLILQIILTVWSKKSKLVNHVNKNSDVKIGATWNFFVRYLCLFVLLFLLFYRLGIDLLTNYHNYPFWALVSFGLGVVVIPVVIASFMPKKILD